MNSRPVEGQTKRKKQYTFSWIGVNGQPGSQTITQGATCYMASGKQKDGPKVQEVTFSSFQMAARANSSEPVGTLRYKTQDGKYLTVLPGAVGQRFLLPQIEHWDLQAPQQVQQSAQCPVNTTTSAQVQQAADQLPSSVQRPSEMHVRQKR